MTRITTDQNQIRVQMEEAMSHADRCEASHNAAIEADQRQCDLEEAAEQAVIDAVESGRHEVIARLLGDVGMAEFLCDFASFRTEAYRQGMSGGPWQAIRALHQVLCDAAANDMEKVQ